jgi:hypothetical protein
MAPRGAAAGNPVRTAADRSSDNRTTDLRMDQIEGVTADDHRPIAELCDRYGNTDIGHVDTAVLADYPPPVVDEPPG